MGKKKEFEDGAVKQGYTKEHADEIFEIMIPFAGYGFNKSHAAAYSVLAYRTGWLKANYPAEFMAANLTNEITSTDGLPGYIEEAKKMGIPVDPPDVNRSDEIFDVADGHIVFGFKGIKGMGENAAKEIVRERKENGPYKDFMDFVERVDQKVVNKRAIEVLIKTGAFDKLGQDRTTLAQNMERAVAYVEAKRRGTENGQGSLFGDSSEEEFVPFVFEQAPEKTKMEILDEEKDLIGCYVSGHPLDEYRKVITECATVNSSNIKQEAKDAEAMKAAAGINSWQSRNFGKTYTAVGMLVELKPINTKKGDSMAFGKLQDFKGMIDITFFPPIWATLRPQIHSGKIYGFKGKLDGSRGTPSFLVDSLENLESLKTHSIHEVHIQLNFQDFSQEKIEHIRDFLFGATGNCSVYFHIDTENGPYIIQANPQLSVPSTPGFIQELKDQNGIADVWLA